MPKNCTPHDLSLIAVELSKQTSSAAKRTSINRAYYAAYHAILPLAELVPGDGAKGPQGNLRHRELPRRLRDWRFLPTGLTRLKPLASKARAAAGQLEGAMDVREAADYDLVNALSDADVELQLSRMKVVLDFAAEAQAEYERLCA